MIQIHDTHLPPVTLVPGHLSGWFKIWWYQKWPLAWAGHLRFESVAFRIGVIKIDPLARLLRARRTARNFDRITGSVPVPPPLAEAPPKLCRLMSLFAHWMDLEYRCRQREMLRQIAIAEEERGRYDTL